MHCSPSAFGLLLHRNRSLALLSAAGLPSAAPAGAWGESLWNVQPVHCSPSAFGLLLHRNRSLALLSAAGLPSAAPAGAWGESLWNVQPVHCSPSAFGLLLHRNRSLALLSAAGLPSAAPANPFQRLWPTPAAQPCLRQAGAWGESPGTCSPCSYGLPKATLGILHRLQTLLPRDFKPFPAPLAYSCIAALPASGGSLGREPWNVQPVLLWASKSDVRHFAPPSNPPPRLQTLPSAFGLLLRRSLALFLFSAARRPASSLLMGFQKRR